MRMKYRGDELSFAGRLVLDGSNFLIEAIENRTCVLAHDHDA